jgi:osmoprotectant transport system substrate-binding protein
MLLLSACGGTGSGSAGTGSNSGSGSKGTITVGGKQDVEAQFLSRMYVLLLRKAGFTVNEKLALGDSPIVLSAIKNGAIDLYPEFTVTGLNALGLKTSYNPQKDYQTVKDGFEKQYKITWLDPSPLNDTYALCTSKQNSEKLGLTSISDVTPKVSQLTLASPSDGIAYVDNLKSSYNFDTKSFKGLQKVDYTIGFSAVSNNQAQVNVCYTTDGAVSKKNFIFLKDPKNGFPAFNPAPIVRDEVLSKNPGIRDALNPLAKYLTTEVSIQLRDQVAQKATNMSTTQAVKEVATDFLKSKGLL